MVGAKIGPQQGWSALHDAAKEDDLDLMICIVEGKMGLPIRDIDLPSESGLTPLHVAALSGSNLCIAYLLGQGCDVELRD
ncbi:MAG: ankyrin repeat domain-containing protein, partial [Promethearchaeia archaeon]